MSLLPLLCRVVSYDEDVNGTDSVKSSESVSIRERVPELLGKHNSFNVFLMDPIQAIILRPSIFSTFSPDNISPLGAAQGCSLLALSFISVRSSGKPNFKSSYGREPDEY